MVNGAWVVQKGQHAHQQNSADNFAILLKKLSA